MSPSAKIFRWSLSLFVVNAILVLVVTSFTRTGHSEEPPEKVDVEIPAATSDPPSLPEQPATGSVQQVESPLSDAGSTAVLPAASAAGAVDDNFVLEEIRKAIRSGDKSLEVPQLTYPSIPGTENRRHDPPIAGPATTSEAEVKLVGKRAASIKQLALAADALASEAQLLASQGRSAEALWLLSQVRAIHNVTAVILRSNSQNSPSVQTVAPSATDGTSPGSTVAPKTPYSSF